MFFSALFTKLYSYYVVVVDYGFSMCCDLDFQFQMSGNVNVKGLLTGVPQYLHNEFTILFDLNVELRRSFTV